MDLTCCSGKNLVLVTELHGSGRVLQPYHLALLTYFGGTAWEAAGGNMGSLGGQDFKAASGLAHATEMPFEKV